MESKREQALVGLFVLIAAALLIVTVFLLSGTFKKGDLHYRAFFKNAGGLGPGSEVRYAGGPPVGRVQSVRAAPDDPTLMEIDFGVRPGVPVKTDSKVTITSVSPLGDNFLGIIPGTAAARRAPRGSTLRSIEYTSLADVTTMLAGLGPSANELMGNLNARAAALQVTIDRVNDLLNDPNRRHIAATLANLNGMLAEDRPIVHSTLDRLNASSEKLGPLIDSFKKTSAQADEAISHIDATIAENRPDLHKAIADLHASLASASAVMDQLNRTSNVNAENLDEIIENLRHVTENLNSFTETIKARPYTLIRAAQPKAHRPGQAPPQ
ncbi:MAG: MlaD family protein [Candidatus Acidiferrales bacterium]